MFFLVIGILQAGNNGLLLVVFLAVGAAFLLWFFLHIRSMARAGKEPLLSMSLFRNRISNLGLVTQNIQWLLLMGSTFTVSVFLQTVRHFTAIKTGVIFTAATVGVLLSSVAQERLAKKYQQRILIRAGFVVAIAGTILVSDLVSGNRSYVLAMVVLVVLALVGLAAAIFLPSGGEPEAGGEAHPNGVMTGTARALSLRR